MLDLGNGRYFAGDPLLARSSVDEVYGTSDDE